MQKVKLLLNYVLLEIRYFLIRFRWALAALALGFTLYTLYEINFIKYLAIYLGLGIDSLNVWDGINAVWFDGGTLYLALLYLLLCSDLEMNEMRISWIAKLSSRNSWWLGRFLFNAGTAFIFIGILACVSFTLAIMLLPWGTAWSEYCHATLNSNNLLELSPLSVFALFSIFLIMGLTFFSMITVCAGILFSGARIKKTGLFTGVIVWLKLFITDSFIIDKRALRIFTPLRILDPFYGFGIGGAILWSFAYWLLLIGIFYYCGLLLTREYDFLGEGG